jgi:hypothetical protein
LEDLGAYGEITIKSIFKKQGDMGDVNWIHLAQDSEEWRAVVKAVMNLRVPPNAGKFLLI